MSPLKILHISAHLGGGVGRVLSKLVQYRRKLDQSLQEIFLCLEEPKDKKFVDILRTAGAELVICSNIDEARQLIASAEIVQVEWWHHPLLPGFLSLLGSVKARIIVWSHVSGLYYPSIPVDFVTFPDLFLFTTSVSMRCRHLIPAIEREDKSRVDVIHSSGGFDDFPIVRRSKPNLPLKCGYVGTYAFAKLHPQVIQFFEAVNLVDYRMDFFGDISAADALTEQMDGSHRLKSRLKLHGYVDNPGSVMAKLDLFVYLLNPLHYGSTENSLIEAMACGVVPIVLDNPVERTIVTHEKTGFVVKNPLEFAEVMAFCAANPEVLLRMGDDASNEARERFSITKTEEKLRQHYTKLMGQPKRRYHFSELMGSKPEEWFAFALGEYFQCFQPEKQERIECRRKRLACPIFYEETKSSVNHFCYYYPKSEQLKQWKDLIEGDITYLKNEAGIAGFDKEIPINCR